MKRVKFKSQFTCAPEGAIVKKFAKGDVADLKDKLAESAVKSGAAEFVKAEEAPKPTASKNKAAKKAPDENKAKGAGADK